MKSRWINSVIFFSLLTLLPGILLLFGATLPSLYQDSYYAELPDMVERLYRTEGKKIVLVGGSNLAFGLDGTLLENVLRQRGYEYTVCPLGLYAAVGTSAMLSLSQNALGEGDMVILAIEPTSETMSCYFGATAFWKCAEEAPELLTRLNREQTAAIVGNYIPYLQERCAIVRSENYPKATGAYSKAAFDENCRMTYSRDGNTLTLGYDMSTPIDLIAVTISEDFAAQVREYCQSAEKKGAAVYLTFSPMNRSALTDESENAIGGYFSLCNTMFPCSSISDPHTYIMDSGWFYDSNFHLNSAGAQLRTLLLATDILAQLGDFKVLDCEYPDMPESIAAISDTFVVDEGGCFTFISVGNEAGYFVSGLTEEGYMSTSLIIPETYHGKPVAGITSTALKEAGQLEELWIPATVEALPDGLFQDCSSLARLVLEHSEIPCSISTNGLDGLEQIRIFVPANAYTLYRDGYGCEINPWSRYLEQIYTY